MPEDYFWYNNYGEPPVMTLMLTPEIEARLRERAARDGKEAHVVAQSLLADALFEDEDDLSDAEIADARMGIRRGLEAVAQGKERLLSDYVSDVQKRRNERAAVVR